MVARDPLRGQLFENMVVLEALKARLNAGKEPALYFYRDNKGHEVDLLWRQHRTSIPIEIKSAMTFNQDFTKGIKYFQKISPSAAHGYIIYAGELTPTLECANVVHFADTATLFD